MVLSIIFVEELVSRSMGKKIAAIAIITISSKADADFFLGTGSPQCGQDLAFFTNL